MYEDFREMLDREDLDAVYIAIRLGLASVRWNPATERFVDDAAADRLLSHPMRQSYAV